ncbi:hypothetical protein [uncultured Cohaesibacter sp.]|uniref:hypothetical protein n=1 Tax=uncultured Cohaesibacter sp. TaxID=1002546 RepID=UPI0029C8C3C2|nr:hypothetical protein [uncultured Cohaesibacter sp.]
MVQNSRDDLPSDDVQVEDDPFLSPEMQEMQRKIRKMVFWSIMVMVLGISSVIGVLIYKSMTKKESAALAQAPNAPVTPCSEGR